MAPKRKGDAAPEARPEKKHKKPNLTVPLVSSLINEEPAFLRGGASILTPLERKQIHIQAKQDVLFEQGSGKKPLQVDEPSDQEGGDVEPTRQRGVHKSKKAGKNSSASGHHTGDEAKGPRIEGLNFKRLVPGSMVLGQVIRINRYDIALALPNNLTGYIPVTAISSKVSQLVESLVGDESSGEDSDEEAQQEIRLTEYFRVGQYLRAHVTSTEDASGPEKKNKRHISLSIAPPKANMGMSQSDLVVHTTVQASVLSVEDHGLVMELGLDDTSVKGFMSSKELGSSYEIAHVKEGSVFLCIVTGQSSNGKIVKLSADAQKIGNVKKGSYLNDAPTIDAYLPGTAVEILISRVQASGIAGKILGLLDVTADLIHSGAAVESRSLESKYAVGTKAKGRIICTFPTASERKLGVSLLNHVLTLSSRSAGPTSEIDLPSPLPISSIVDRARVIRVERGIGLFLDIGVKGFRAFVHISRVADHAIDDLAEEASPYKIGTLQRARIVGFNPMDGLLLASMEKKVLELPFLRLEDVEVGIEVKGTVDKLIVNARGVAGVLVKLTESITGLVPELHLADVQLQHPERKFREGLAVTARVLSTNLENRQLRLTLKKSLVNSDSMIWKSYADLEVGMQAPGTLVSILPTGAVVQFYGSVRGFLPVAQMSESYIPNPAEHFKVGQVVKVHITSVDPLKERMVVSCRDLASFDPAQQSRLAELTPGTLVSATVSQKTTTHIIVELEGSGLKGILPILHLSDASHDKSLRIAMKIRVGQRLQDLLVLSKDVANRWIKLTSKPSLVGAQRSERLVRHISELVVGAEVAGFVKNITATGVFVQFAAGLTGLLLKSHLPDDVLGKPDFGFHVDQSITSTVLTIDHENMRFLLTQKSMPTKRIEPTAPMTLAFHDERLTNAVDGESESIGDFVFGKSTKAEITSVKSTQLNVRLADGLQGRVAVSQVYDSLDEISNRKQPLKKFKAHQILPVRVMGIHDSRSHRFLPISHTKKISAFELTAKPSDQRSADLQLPSLDTIARGSQWLVFVNNVRDDCLWVNLSSNIRGRIRASEASNDILRTADLHKNFPPGCALRATVLAIDHEADRVELSAIANATSSEILEDFSVGMVVPSRITKVSERQIMVQLRPNISAPVNLIDLADDYSKAKTARYEKNQVVRVYVRDIDTTNKKITLSTRPSKVSASAEKVVDPEISSVSQLHVNDVVRGFVKRVADNGLFVTLASHITAYVRISDLSDLFIKDWKSDFQVDQLVRGKVIHVDPARNHVQLSLKQSVLQSDFKKPLIYSDLVVGQTVTGKVRLVQDFGAFIVIDDSANVSGLCHRSEMADEPVADARKLYEEGDVVKAKVLKVESEKQRVSLGLKASYFDEQHDGADDDDSDELDVRLARNDDDEPDDDDMGGVELDVSTVREVGDDHQASALRKQALNPIIEKEEVQLTSLPTKGLSVGDFDWTGDIGAPQSHSDTNNTDVDDEPPKRKRKKAPIQVDRTGDLDAQPPQSVADFERLLLGQPNSSYLWLMYMAFQLQLSETDKARDIAERALRTINHQSQENDLEALNVWVAFLNLENTYGNDESVDEIFKRACEYNDPEDIHARLTSIYIQSGKHSKADELLQTMVKKSSNDSKTWLNYANFLFDTLAAPQRARDLLPRALQALPKEQHLDLTSKFAQLEFRSASGDAERGRTIFEGILSTFPKRLDLWNVLLDLEIKQGDGGRVRPLFERVTSRKLKPRKAKFFFKRWLEYEEKEGDAASREKVQARASEYVRQQAAQKLAQESN